MKRENPTNRKQHFVTHRRRISNPPFLIFPGFAFLSDGVFGSGGGRKELDGSGAALSKQELDGLTPFEKNFYIESPSVASMTESDVEAYRRRRQITVEGRDVPKPVREFRDVGFPGNSLPLSLRF